MNLRNNKSPTIISHSLLERVSDKVFKYMSSINTSKANQIPFEITKVHFEDLISDFLFLYDNCTGTFSLPENQKGFVQCVTVLI